MTHDLAVVAADKSMAETLRGLLSRPEAIGMRRIKTPTIVEHPSKDPGVWKTGYELLAMYAQDYQHGLVLLDHKWNGNPHDDPVALAEEIEAKCRKIWGDRARCIVIDPELETWVWSSSPHVARVLKWDDNETLRNWLQARGFWHEARKKPTDPKAAFRAVTREKRVPPSASRFRKLAETVTLSACEDPAFGMLVETLRSWFPCERE